MNKIIDIITKVKEHVHILEFLSCETSHTIKQDFFKRNFGEVNLDEGTVAEIEHNANRYDAMLVDPKAIVDGYDYIFKAMEMCANYHERYGKHTTYSIWNWYVYAPDINMIFFNERNIKKVYKNVATHFNFL